MRSMTASSSPSGGGLFARRAVAWRIGSARISLSSVALLRGWRRVVVRHTPISNTSRGVVRTTLAARLVPGGGMHDVAGMFLLGVGLAMPRGSSSQGRLANARAACEDAPTAVQLD